MKNRGRRAAGRGFAGGADFRGRAEKPTDPSREPSTTIRITFGGQGSWLACTALLLPYAPLTQSGAVLTTERGNDGPNRRGNPNLRPSSLDRPSIVRAGLQVGPGGHRSKHRGKTYRAGRCASGSKVSRHASRRRRQLVTRPTGIGTSSQGRAGPFEVEPACSSCCPK